MALDKDSELKFPEILLIDASAGSGKTHTLTKRLIQFLLSDRLESGHNDLSNILAITFTNNAAREMKQRVIKYLKMLAMNMGTDEEKDELYALFSLKPEEVRKKAEHFINTLIDRYADLHVQTIDSFMNRILRSSADELGMPPENEVTESYTELMKVSSNMLFAQVGTGFPLSEMDAFLEFFNQIQSSFQWNPANDIKRTFATFLEQEGRILENIQFQDYSTEVQKKYIELRALYEKAQAMIPQKKIPVGIQGNFLDKAVKDPNYSKIIGHYKNDPVGLRKTFSKALLSEQGGSELVEEIRQSVSEMVDRYSLAKYSPYEKLYGHFKECLEAVKRQMRTIHFDDINKRLSRYVKEEIVPEIYYRLGDMLYHFLLDEFQDTAPVQWNNIIPLLDEAFAKGGTLFVVGDLKQAIYLFRKADYRIMRNLKLCIEKRIDQDCLPPSVKENARIIPLEHNFRSGSVILDYINSLFKERLADLMPAILAEDRTGLTTYTQDPLPKKEGHGYVRTIIVPDDSDGAPEKQVLIDIVKDAKQRYPLNEIAILTYENEEVENIVSWLTEENIPAASFSSLDIRKRKIIMELCSLLRFLGTPIDDLSFASFLTGNIFLSALKADGSGIERQAFFDLIAESKGKRKGYLYTFFREHPQYKELWKRYFDNLFKVVGYYPIYDLVSDIYKVFSVFANFPKESAFLVRFLEAVSALESKGKGSIKELEELAQEEKKAPILEITLPDYVDAVKIMTFHKAKGLGFDVVINVFNKQNRRAESMFFDHMDKGLHVRYITMPMRDSNAHLKELYEEAELDEHIQMLNLTYVALTRPRHELYNLVVRKERSGEKSDILEFQDLFSEYESGKKEGVAPGKKPYEHTDVSVAGPPPYPAMRDEDKHWSIERHVESKKGDLFHRILADIEYLDDTSADAILALVTRAIQAERIAYAPAKIHAVLMKFLEIPEVRKWFEKKEGRQVLRECEFVNEEGRVYRMDRVVADEDRIMLIDFKTGSPLDFYAQQMENYKRMLQHVYPGKPIECFHAYVDSGRIEKS